VIVRCCKATCSSSALISSLSCLVSFSRLDTLAVRYLISSLAAASRSASLWTKLLVPAFAKGIVHVPAQLINRLSVTSLNLLFDLFFGLFMRLLNPFKLLDCRQRILTLRLYYL